ncbi:MAG: aldehyde dehydrogenase family protein, partial [Propionibacterium sp.]|nr:aldehyde dehydrogenase family protein [Propionibacterium sp.]
MHDILERVPSQHFIGGEWVGEPALAVHDPASGEVIARVADADVATAVSALDAACDAADGWAATDPRDRGELLRRAFELIHERADDFATLMTLEMGKPLAEARGEVAYGAEFFRWFSEEAVRIHGRFGRAPSGPMRIVTDKVPVGPVFAITPWNFPLAMATRKIGPAIAAGCTTVVKPASETPLTMLLLMEVLTEAGMPAGVVNVFNTSNAKDTSAAVISDPRLRKLTFTGSTGVGKQLLRQAADNVLRSSMELGGNAPLIVLESADLEKAVEGTLVAKMRNNGQACTAANRFFVHESVAEEFERRLHERLSDWRLGPGMEEGTQLGPLIHDRAVGDIVGLIDDAVEQGATVTLGGGRADRPGSFLEPTILTGVGDG